MIRLRRPDALVLVVAVLSLAAFVMLLVEPPFIGADELYHWQRATQIAGGGLLGERLGPNEWGGRLDRAAFDVSIRFFLKYIGQAHLDWDGAQALARTLAARPAETVTMPFPSTATFSPLAYLPQAAAIALARLAALDVLWQSYAGRAANLVVYAALVLTIRRVLPWGAAGLVMVACIPATLHVAGTLSADPLNFTLPMLLVALVLRARARGGPVSPWARAGLLLLCAGLALLKPTLVLVAPVVLLLPRAAFASVWGGWLFKAACIAAAVLAGGAWNAAYPFVPGVYWGTGADPAATLALFRADPMAAAALFARSVATFGAAWWHDLYGKFGGHAAPYYFHSGLDLLDWLGLAAIVASAALAGRPPRPDRVAACWLAALAVLYAAMVVAAFAIGFTRPGDPLILGVQGRYFLVPAGLLALAIAAADLAPRTPRAAGLAAVAVAALLSLGMLAAATVRLGQFWSL